MSMVSKTAKERIEEMESNLELLIEIGQRLCELADPGDPNDPISELLGYIEDHIEKNLERNGCGSKRYLLQSSARGGKQ